MKSSQSVKSIVKIVSAALSVLVVVSSFFTPSFGFAVDDLTGSINNENSKWEYHIDCTQ